jgi:hypothetical protein
MTLRVHIEAADVDDDLAEVGQLQRARASTVPLLSSCSSHQHGLASTRMESGRLHLRPLSSPTCDDVHERAIRSIGFLEPLARLVGLPAATIERRCGELVIESAQPAFLLERILASSKSLPVQPLEENGPVEFVSCNAEQAVRAFEAGALDATAPTCFEIGEQFLALPTFRETQLDVYAFLLIKPGSPVHGAIHDPRFKQRFDARFSWPRVCAPVTLGDAADGPHDWFGTTKAPAIDLHFSDYWPNRAIADALRATFGEFGHDVRPNAVPLDHLRAASTNGAYELALILAVGYAGPFVSMPVAFARAVATSGGRAPQMEQALGRAFRAGEDGEAWADVTRIGARLCSVLPLCSFRAGYLARETIPTAPLAFGAVLSVEHFEGGCQLGNSIRSRSRSTT